MKGVIETNLGDFPAGPAPINNRVYVLGCDESLGDTLAIPLGAENFQITLFSDLSAIETHSRNGAPAAILVDMDNPLTGDSNLEAITHLRQSLQPCPSIICLSTATGIEHRLAAARAGSARYFSKPLDLGKLSRTLHSLCSTAAHGPYRVMLIDDDENLLALFAAPLRRAGITVETVSDPHQGLEALAAFVPDLLLLDVNMPGISGAELAMVIRQDDSFAQLPILYLSMLDAPEQQESAMELAGDEFISKQIDPQRLVLRVKERIKSARETKRINQGLRDALHNSELRRFALDNHAIVSATDVNGTITYVNDTFCQISGYRRDELLGNNHRLLKSGQHPDGFYTDMWVTLTQGKTWQGTICNRRKDGSDYWVDSTIVPFLDKDGLPYQYISVRTDITALQASEDRLHRSQVFANIGTWDWNIQTGDLYWSERIGPLFGYHQPLPATSYDHFLDAIHPEDRQRVIDAINRCVEQGAEYNIEHRVRWLDGTVRWVVERGNVVRNEHGTPLRMLGVVQDISQRKQVEAELLKHKTAMDSSLEGIAILDPGGNYRYLNPALIHIYGYETADELIGRPWTAHYSAEELLRFEEEVMPKLECLQQWSGEATGLRKDGGHFPQLLSLSYLGDRDLLCIVHDISIRKQTERELIATMEAAEQANQAKSQFLSNMSHELRTPMNAIIGFGQLLRLEPLNQIQHDNVGEILSAGNHLLDLINEVLDLSRVEAGRLDLVIEDVMLADVMMECIGLIAPLAEQRHIDIITTHKGREIGLRQQQQLGAVVHTDRTRLKQALINLLSNAVKYNHENGQVTVDCQSMNEGFLRISISDTGAGISLEKQTQLFQPFNRLGAENTETEGTGIGLVYTKKIIELMKGHVGVQSTLGEGSTFWIELPGCYSASTTAGSEKSENTQTAVTGNADQGQYTVLYVEDNPANMRLMEQLLKRRSNIRLLKATDARAGLDMAAKQRPDLIMLDINLPEMSGYDMLHILQQDHATQGIPVLAISANAMPEDEQQALDAGFRQYITKPIKLQQVLDSLDETLITRSG
ncbi:MAG: response regulator [Gammaproteobacteria bacterium]|nr:response regulator [Gammaproteobacteria bacterium]